MYVYAITHVHRTVGPDASDVRALAAVAKAIIHKKNFTFIRLNKSPVF